MVEFQAPLFRWVMELFGAEEPRAFLKIVLYYELKSNIPVYRKKWKKKIVYETMNLCYIEVGFLESIY